MKAAVENKAIIPVPKIETDSYDWWERHKEVLDQQKEIDPEIVLVGDSITHYWGGLPDARVKQGGPAWAETFGDTRVLNMGFGWDRTQNVLWRLEHGEFEGLHPRVVVLNIGTNNFSDTNNYKADKPEEICEAIIAICKYLHSVSPTSEIVLMKVFPRGEFPDDPLRIAINTLNGYLEEQIPGLGFVRLLDIGGEIVEPDGRISSDTLFDFTHLTPKAYRIWGKALIDAGVVRK